MSDSAAPNKTRLPNPTIDEPSRSGFKPANEPHPSDVVASGPAASKVGIQELRDAIPAHCFKPNYLWSFFYLFRDLTYAFLLLYLYTKIPTFTSQSPFELLHYPLVIAYTFVQGLVWTGLWIIAHECGHSAFLTSGFANDAVGFILHSFLLAPYFSWKSTHRRHHLYAGHMDKDINYVPPLRDVYAAKLGLKPGQLDELGEDTPIVLFLRILLQQTIGWNWYILSNITCPPSALVKKGMATWRHSHFDPWGALFRTSEVTAIILSDVGCLITLMGLWALYKWTGSFEQVFWMYIAPWTWVNHWIVMITYLHHTHPNIPKYASEEWTFILGATATMDRYFDWPFGFIGTHLFHNISTDHVIHHLFSKIPHYYSREATNAIIPLLGPQYRRGGFGWNELRLSFAKCQWVEADETKDRASLDTKETNEKVTDAKSGRALWYRSGPSPSPEYRMRQANQDI
ncbi:hypothetical protein QQZ08_007253 [Neonectria magnoliae]|uniref:Fatty acid desaturase domain-containing protein n=1 Tax=Neonectria magnoliae TaxID=2732573 RepID=A0ABR1HZ24_9HYPO